MLIVYNVLEKVYFQKFLNSSLYKKYTNEIVSNTVFGMNKMSKIEKAVKQQKEESGKVLKEEPLWKRANSKTMQLGLIDSTGRFIRNFKTNIDNERENIDEENDIMEKLADDDDVWSLKLDDNFNLDLKNAANNSLDKKLKNKFDKLINLLPINNGRSKSTEDEQEIAERIAAMLVSDVIKANQL
jgi:hypothetical protein